MYYALFTYLEESESLTHNIQKKKKKTQTNSGRPKITLLENGKSRDRDHIVKNYGASNDFLISLIR